MSNASTSYFDDRSIIRRVKADRSAAPLSGVCSLFIEALHAVNVQSVEGTRVVTDPGLRLMQTAWTLEQIYFGTKQEADAAAQRVLGMHAHVKGAITNHHGSIPDGTQFDANNADAQRWVIAAMIESDVHVYGILVHPLTAGERDQLVREYQILAQLLGMPDSHLFRSYTELQQYMDGMYRTVGRTDLPPMQRLELTPANRRRMVEGAFWPDHPLMKLEGIRGQWERLMTGLLPPRVRDIYQIHWSSADETWLERAAGIIKLSAAIWRPEALLNPLNWNPIAVALVKHFTPGPQFYGRPRPTSGSAVRH